MRSRANRLAAAMLMLAAMAPSAVRAQGSTPLGLPPLLPDSVEIALALTAAPPALTANSSLFVLRRGGYVRVREGTNGFSCLVARDHPESLYPICYDAEGSRSIMRAEMRERELVEQRKTDEEIARTIAAEYVSGALRAPAGPAMVYMMSPRQMIYSSARGRRVGAWHPHLMMYVPYATRAQFGLFDDALASNVSVDQEGKPTAHMVILLREWSTGERADKAAP